MEWKMTAPENDGKIQDWKMAEKGGLEMMEWKMTAPEKGGKLQDRKMVEKVGLENDSPGQ